MCCLESVVIIGCIHHLSIILIIVFIINLLKYSIIKSNTSIYIHVHVYVCKCICKDTVSDIATNETSVRYIVLTLKVFAYHRP